MRFLTKRRPSTGRVPKEISCGKGVIESGRQIHALSWLSEISIGEVGLQICQITTRLLQRSVCARVSEPITANGTKHFAAI